MKNPKDSLYAGLIMLALAALVLLASYVIGDAQTLNSPRLTICTDPSDQRLYVCEALGPAPDNPPPSAAAPAWYERSYIWPKEQQEQMVRTLADVVLRTYGVTMPTPNPLTPTPDADDGATTADIAADLSISEMAVRLRADRLRIVGHPVRRAGRLRTAFTAEEVADIKALPAGNRAGRPNKTLRRKTRRQK